LQQVAAHILADTAPVDPRRLPVPLSRQGRRLVVRANHVWVLHRQVMLRVLAALLALFAIVGIYEARHTFEAAGTALFRMAQGEFSQAGFGITSINVTGQRLTDDAAIAALLTVGMGDSTLSFDVRKAQARLEWLRAVKSATVRKVYPNQIAVSIVEKTPLVRWRVGDVTWLIDDAGDRIGTDVASYTNLPLVIGDGAADDAVPMTRLLERHPAIADGLAALSRIGDRRWDLIYRDGLRVELPEFGVAQALDQLDMYQRDYQLLGRDVTLIDLRVEGLVSLRPGEVAAAQIAADRKKNKHAMKGGDSEYETAAERKAQGN
jgi:cell division protein FtsQ